MIGHSSHAHALLVEKAQTARKCAVSLMESGSRDFEVMQEFVDQYVSYLQAADWVALPREQRDAIKAGK